MGRRRVTYYQVFCDYPKHDERRRELPKGAEYKLFDANSDSYAVVICADCWSDKLIVEDLLKMLHIHMIVDKVGRESVHG